MKFRIKVVMFLLILLNHYGNNENESREKRKTTPRPEFNQLIKSITRDNCNKNTRIRHHHSGTVSPQFLHLWNPARSFPGCSLCGQSAPATFPEGFISDLALPAALGRRLLEPVPLCLQVTLNPLSSWCSPALLIHHGCGKGFFCRPSKGNCYSAGKFTSL